MLTNIKPHPVGKNARQQTIKSFIDRSQTLDRMMIIARTAMKRNALKSLKARWKLVLNCCLPMFTACIASRHYVKTELVRLQFELRPSIFKPAASVLKGTLNFPTKSSEGICGYLTAGN